MFIDDEYLKHLSLKNSTYLNTDTKSKDLYSVKPNISKTSFNNITLMQQIYLSLITILLLKILSATMYFK